MSGVQAFSYSSSKLTENMNSLGHIARPVNIILPEQTSESSMEFTLPLGSNGGSSDPFFDSQSSGVLSTERFTVSSKDLVGETTISGCYLTQYSISCSIGEPARGSVSYEGEVPILDAGSFLLESQQTDDDYTLFKPSNIFITPDFADGIGTSGHCVQNFSLSFSIDRLPVTRLTQNVPYTRYPTLPIFGELTMSVIKNQLVGVDVSSIVVPTGAFAIDLCDTDNDPVIRYIVSGCMLEDVSSNSSLDENETLDFSYRFPLSNLTFSREVL